MSKKHFEDECRLAESTFRRKFGNDETIGFCSALCSSAFYTVSLFMLRQLTDYQDICSSDWSLAVKELTTVVCVLPLILIQCIRGKYRFPDWKTLLIVFTAGVMCQVVGARPHLMAYAAIGIALTTPLIQAIQLTGTSVIGAVYLKEKVSKTKAVTILLLIAAICLLSLSGLGDSVGKIAGQPMRIWFGLLCVISTGIGYSSQLLLMRTVLRKSRENNGASHV
ncbi:MAG: hypothetical protein IKW74_03080, partial [Thermoguttaceae bacterium]|nr:hypothetical protein [Thermoguttaceae bacterium]